MKWLLNPHEIGTEIAQNPHKVYTRHYRLARQTISDFTMQQSHWTGSQLNPQGTPAAQLHEEED